MNNNNNNNDNDNDDDADADDDDDDICAHTNSLSSALYNIPNL